jgi:hypothetical protein
LRSSVTATDLDTLRSLLAGGVIAPCALAPSPGQLLTAGTLMWPWEHSNRVLHEWRGWIAAAPDTVTSAARIIRAPDLAGIARALRGRAFVAVDVAIEGAAADARLVPLRRMQPELDTVAPVSAEALLARHAPVEGERAIGEYVTLRALPAAAVDALVAAAGPTSRTELVSAEVRNLGGARFAIAAIGIAGGDEQAERVRVALEQLVRRLAPWAESSAAREA